MKLSDWAKKQGISYLTAYRWFKDGKLPVKAYQSDSGTIIVQDDSDVSEQAMAGNSQNEVMSLFLKKTVEYSKNNSSIEEFAAYVLSTFQLKLNTDQSGPKYSRNRPKAEDVQKHFQQFIPKGEKPKPNSFVIEPDKLDELAAQSDKDLVAEIKAAVASADGYPEKPTTGFIKFGDATPANLYDSFSEVFTANAAAPIAEGIVTRSVDLNTTPQQINYTGSTNSAFSNSFSSSVVLGDSTGGGLQFSAGPSSAYLVSNNVTNTTATPFSSSFQPTQKELQAATKVIETAEQPRARRGRKPSKNKG